MKVFLGQIYGEPGVSFPFSHHMQTWLGNQLSDLATPSSEFLKKYSADFDLMVRVSARTKSAEVEVKGPTVFKKTKDVEYTVFLPYEVIVAAEDGCRAAMDLLMNGIQEVFARAHIEAPEFEAKKASMVEGVCSDAAMLKQPWLVALPRRESSPR